MEDRATKLVEYQRLNRQAQKLLSDLQSLNTKKLYARPANREKLARLRERRTTLAGELGLAG